MKIRTLGILAIAAIAATGCKKADSDGAETTTADSTVVAGTDTVSQPTVVPTQDTVVTTTTQETDTVHGNATDTTAHDTTKKM
ncbi:MAG TPA: hypothetical protein VM890_15140 [Longimicrobium sp.]|jgi:hypothetical protein|nr:hypothetical protein [Longimicrobium sp.]